MSQRRCPGCMRPIESYPCPSCGYTGRDEKATAYTLTPGRVLKGKYLVGKVLGTGGFGITYLGLNLVLDRKVAIKEFYPSGCAGRNAAESAALQWYTDEKTTAIRNEGLQSVLSEAKKMAKADNIPLVVGVEEVFEENNTAYIIMDYVEGVTLKQYLFRNGPITWEQAKSFFFPIIRALYQVHRAGLIHRDISPDNLMVLADGSMKILDLGAAKDVSAGSGGPSAAVVKNGFSPFEQYAQRGSAGPWSDVYAMAATMVYSLTGKLPVSAIDRAAGEELDWNLPELQALPVSVRSALQKAMEISMQNRIQSMDAFLQALEGQTVQEKTEKNGSKRRWPIVLAGAVAAVLLLAVATVFLPKTEKPYTPEKAEPNSAISNTISMSTEEVPRARVEEQVLLDDGDFKATLTGITYTSNGVELAIDMENDSLWDAKFQLAEGLVVNGFSIDDYLYCDVPAGGTESDTVTIYYDELDELGIDVITTLEFELVVKDEDYDVLAQTELLEIRTTEYGNYEQPEMEHGILLYQTQGVKIYDLGLSEYHYCLYIVNDSDQLVFVRSDAFAINGFAMDGTLYKTLYPGTSGICNVWLSEQDFLDAQIDVAESVMAKFLVGEEEPYKELGESEFITWETGLTGDAVQEIEHDADFIIYDENGITVSYKGLSPANEDTYSDAAILLYVENNSTEYITVRMDDVTINEQEGDVLSENGEVPPGYKAMCRIYPGSYYASSIDAEEILELAGAIQFKDEGYKTISTVSVTFYFESGDWPI